jgi:diguanylate cyclase (GGDEF)-like protein
MSDGRSIQVVGKGIESGGWVATVEDITERQRVETRIAHMAHYDALTELPNRVLFRERLDDELKNISQGRQLAVFYIDIDEFKRINDSLGHPVGDELLKAVAGRLGSCVAAGDVVARLGGDEFAIIQTAIKRPADTMDLITRIYQAIREPYECFGHLLTTDASIGIARAPQDGTDLDQLLKNADLAMYEAKADGTPDLSLLRARHGCPHARPAHAGAGSPAGDRRWRIRDCLSAAGEPRGWPGDGLRGSAALAASAARHDLAGRIHPGGRRDRNDQRARRVGVEQGLFGSGFLA